MLPLFKVFIGSQASRNVAKVLASSYIGEGPRVKEFEAALDATLGTSGILTTNSCTSALILALKLAGVEAGDEVATTPMTCAATTAAILAVGATPSWYDTNPLAAEAADLGGAITDRTKAVLLVSWGGIPLNRPNTLLPVIVDNAHGVLTPQPGDYICYSFQAIKHLTTGDGGAILAPKAQQERARLLRWFGLDRESNVDFRCKQQIKESGYKAQMNDIAAAIGLANLLNLKSIVELHRENAKYYCEAFSNLKVLTSSYFIPSHSYWLFTLLAPNREDFMAYMRKEGIETSPVHVRNDLHPAYSMWGKSLPMLNNFSEHNVAIPVGWWLTTEEREYIAQKVLNYDNAC